MKKEARVPVRLHTMLYTKPGLEALAGFLRKTGVATRRWRLEHEEDQVETWSTPVGWGRIPTDPSLEEEESPDGTESGEETG